MGILAALLCGRLEDRGEMDIIPTLAWLLFSTCLVCANVFGHYEQSDWMGDLSGLQGDLAFDLYRGMAANRPQENVLLSPLAVSSALAFLLEDSDSQAQRDILSALGMSDRDAVNRACSAWTELVKSLSGMGGDIHLATGSSLHVDKTSLSPKFRNHSRGSCDGALHPVDFSDLQQAKKNINSFIEKETRGNITDFLRSLNISAKSLLANYMYFKGRWETPFLRRHTVNWRFQVNNSLAVEVPMMFRGDTEELKMLYDTNCSSTVVRLPYAGPVSMLLLLPRGEMDQHWPDGCLSITRMKFWLTNLKSGRAEIRLPKFVLRKMYPLQSILKPAGFQTLFTHLEHTPGFSSNQKLRLQAVHEAILEVDETESESQGGTSAMLDFSEPQRIIFDRPFMLLVYHEPTVTVLLIGKITNPAES